MRVIRVFRRLRRDRPVRGVVVGFILFAVAGTLRLFLGGLSEGFGPMTFLPAILLASLFGGIMVGLVIAILCVLVGWIWFFPPYGTFTLAARDVITMAIFILTAALELYVVRMLRLAIDDLAVARERSNTLFRELQHRVANNLQFVAALLYLSKKTLEADSAGAQALEAARSRLDLMARVHRRLNDPSAVDLPVASYLRELGADLIKASAKPGVCLTVEAPSAAEFDHETLMSVSLIIAELVTNSLKHAFRGQSEGNIKIRLDQNRGTYILTVADDGCGLPAAFGQNKGDRLGQGILQSLASQVGGQISFESGQGTTARLAFACHRTKPADALTKSGGAGDMRAKPVARWRAAQVAARKLRKYLD